MLEAEVGVDLDSWRILLLLLSTAVSPSEAMLKVRSMAEDRSTATEVAEVVTLGHLKDSTPFLHRPVSTPGDVVGVAAAEVEELHEAVVDL
jgi:hypothetical protein